MNNSVFVQIEDENFRKAVLKKIGYKFNIKFVLRKEIETIEHLDLENAGITDLTGIEHFKNLKSINIKGNNIKNLNLLMQFEEAAMFCDIEQQKILNKIYKRYKAKKEKETYDKKMFKDEKLEEFFKGIPHDIKEIKRLNLEGLDIESLEGIERLEKLEELNIYNTKIKDLRPLLKLENLNKLQHLEGNSGNEICILQSLRKEKEKENEGFKNDTKWSDTHYNFEYILTEKDIENKSVRLDPYFVSQQWRLGEKDNTGILFHQLKTIARFNTKNDKEREIKALYNQVKRLAILNNIEL